MPAQPNGLGTWTTEGEALKARFINFLPLDDFGNWPRRWRLGVFSEP